MIADTGYHTICKVWGSCHGEQPHWAYYTFIDLEDQMYWITEHRDDAHRIYWRHNDYMSIPCTRCGAYSPLRANTQFLGGPSDVRSCQKSEIKDYHPLQEFPDTLIAWRENGWLYIFFKETLSDSLDGQETFTIKRLPTTDEVKTQLEDIPLENAE